MKNVLIVGAHYDDAELGVGGTAAKLVNEGLNVYKLTLTDNVTNFVQKNIIVKNETSKISSNKACAILGVKEITDFKPVPCNHLSYNTELMQRVEKIIFDYNIDTLFFHFDHDLNRDHVEASKICLVAGRHCKNLLMFQSNGYIPDNQFQPTFFVDISKYIGMKEDALAQYGKEHNRFGGLFEMNLARNEVWGYACEVKRAEGFMAVKIVVSDEN